MCRRCEEVDKGGAAESLVKSLVRSELHMESLMGLQKPSWHFFSNLSRTVALKKVHAHQSLISHEPGETDMYICKCT